VYPIITAEFLSDGVKRFVIAAPRVARRPKPGQFVIVRIADAGERIPLTIADSDPAAGTIELIVKAVGATTEQMVQLETGDAFTDVAGPLGRPTDIEHLGHAVLVGGGVGTAVIYPQARALKKAGNFVSAIIGGQSRDAVILEPQLRDGVDIVHVCTDDGSWGFHGFVTGKLSEVIDAALPPVNVVYAAGPVPMMRTVADLTRPANIKTIVSLNPVMVDGTGMCGGCRVKIAGQVRFACVEGPEFDGHDVDFDELAARLKSYRRQEKTALQQLHPEPCRAAEAAEQT
jgi:ferredoxin--NADP+ reductase